MIPRRNSQKIKNSLEQNFEGKKNYMKLDEDDTQPSNLNSKYQNLILVRNIRILFFFLLCSILVKNDLIGFDLADKARITRLVFF